MVQETGYEPVRQAVQIYNTSQMAVLIDLRKQGGAMAQAEPGETVSVRELSLPHEARSS